MIGDWNLQQLKVCFGGERVNGDALFSGVSTDTRSLQPGELFVALTGPNFDGNRFVAQALAKGAAAAVVSAPQPVALPQWCVTDTRIALGQIAGLNRERFVGPVVAVTGSSGKTTVKEMLASILALQGPVLATRGNLNNDIGAPLTLLTLSEEHRAAVIELGASAEGEIAYTVALTRPQVAILNNAMGAHLEGFGSLQGVVRAKSEIFDGLQAGGTAVINLDDAHAAYWLDKTAGQGLRRLTFGVEHSRAGVSAWQLKMDAAGCYGFELRLQQASYPVQLQVLGRHNVANALAASAAAAALALPPALIVAGLERFAAVKGRMRPLAGYNGARLIDDSYNANPGSVRAAADLLASLPGKRILVLGDMGELGATAREQHSETGAYAAQKGIDCLLAVGALGRATVAEFLAQGGKGRHFENKDVLIEYLRQRVDAATTVLVKGSRSARMEEVVMALQEGESD